MRSVSSRAEWSGAPSGSASRFSALAVSLPPAGVARACGRSAFEAKHLARMVKQIAKKEKMGD